MGVCELSTMPNKRSITAKVIKLRTHCCCGRMSRDMKLSTNFAHRMFFAKNRKNLAQATTTNYLEFIYSMYKPCDFTFYKSLVPKKHVSSTTINSVWKKIILSSTGSIAPII